MDLSNHTITNIPYDDPKWLEFRLNGIGGSEVGILFPEVCGGEYNNPTRLYYEKIGWIQQNKYDNEAMAFGRWLEEIIANRWQYWDGKKDEFGEPNYISNYKNDNIQRKCRRLNGYVQNQNYPWLFSSVDRIMNVGSLNLITREIMDKEGILECKTISGYVAEKWVSGIPPHYLFQVQSYMLVLGLDYVEIALLKDGRNLDVIPLQISPAICNQIIERTKAFWYNRVIPGKKAVADYKRCERFSDTAGMQKAEGIILSLEPDPTPGESYKEFIKERFTTERSTTKGEYHQLLLLRQYDIISTIAKMIDVDKSLLYNTIINEFRLHKTNTLDFGDDGYARFSTKLTNKVKASFDKNALKRAVENLNTTYL